LLVATGQIVSRITLLTEILHRLEHHYDLADRGESPKPMWEQRLITIGKRVEIDYVGQTVPLIGTVEGTGEWGQLLVRDDSGLLHTVTAGDVKLLEVFP
jgi:biotin-(acetyl-CoA carboxylase) ligase